MNKRGDYYKQSRRNSFTPTRVVGVRGTDFFWDSVEEVAERQSMSRNGFIIKVLSEYIMQYGNDGK